MFYFKHKGNLDKFDFKNMKESYLAIMKPIKPIEYITEVVEKNHSWKVQ